MVHLGVSVPTAGPTFLLYVVDSDYIHILYSEKNCFEVMWYLEFTKPGRRCFQLNEKRKAGRELQANKFT